MGKDERQEAARSGVMEKTRLRRLGFALEDTLTPSQKEISVDLQKNKLQDRPSPRCLCFLCGFVFMWLVFWEKLFTH